MIWNCPHCETSIKLKTKLIVGVPVVAECLSCKGLARITLEENEEKRAPEKKAVPPPFVVRATPPPFSPPKKKVSAPVLIAVAVALLSGAYLIYQSKRMLYRNEISVTSR